MTDLFPHGEPVSDKAREFASDLEALCRRHGVQLAVAGYDGLELWTLTEGEQPVHAPYMQDRTEGAGQHVA